MPEVDITFFGRPKCIDCNATKEVFRQAGFPEGTYNYRDVRSDQKANQEATKICQGLGRPELSVPVIVINIPTGPDSGQMTFVEPRGLQLKTLSAALLALRK